MTLSETGIVMSILSAAYPQFYRNQTDEERENALKLWASMFAIDDPSIVAAAVQALIVSDEKGYPPHIGAVKTRIRQITEPPEMTELEGWAFIKLAIRNASMSPSSRKLGPDGIDQRTSAERNFEALPPMIQRLVGSPTQLAAWAQLPSDQIETIIQSNFMRSYRARSASEREFNALPENVKTLIGGIKLLPEEKEGK